MRFIYLVLFFVCLQTTVYAINSPDKILANTKVPLISYFSLVEPGSADTLVQETQLWYGQALIKGTKYQNIPLLSATSPTKVGGHNKSMDYIDIPTGAITINDISNNYNNLGAFEVVKLTGREVRLWLERVAGVYNQISLVNLDPQNIINVNYPISDFYTFNGGITYKIDLTQPPHYDVNGKVININAYRINDLKYNGKLITDNMQFLVVTNSNKVKGSGDFVKFTQNNVIINTKTTIDAIITKYLEEHKVIIASKANNWNIMPIPGVVMYFTTGKNANKYLQQHPEFKKLKENVDGSILLRLRD